MSQQERTPETLRVVEEFLNSRDVEAGQEELADPGTLAAWCAERDLLAGGTPLTDADLRAAREVREALRSLILANGGEPLERAAVDRLNRAADAAPVVVGFGDDGTSRLRPEAAGIDAALARILGAVYTAMADGTWTRLKACRKHSCRWVFYDHSRNRSRSWCSMAVCGNRAKAAEYRKRHKTENLA